MTDIRKGDRVAADVYGWTATGVVTKVLTHDVVLACDSPGDCSGEDGRCVGHKVMRAHAIVTRRARRKPADVRFETVPDSIRRWQRTFRRSWAYRPFDVTAWRDHPDLLAVEIDGEVLLDKEHQ
ncbi:hypothetical protein GCM10009733_008280 [Nonomuraea maheshkhaliensis]|uniref:Transposase n=1 Tax=Nonomuraea maheshkhaliensis TaxID=419590 RepID=A0ABP4QKH5_9ACTN